MMDFSKLNNLSIGLNILNLLNFAVLVDKQTGEVLNRKQSALVKNLVFTITPGDKRTVKVKGSLHKFANNGTQNYDKFTYSRFMDIVEDLRPFISNQDSINVLEFGVNIHTPFHPGLFIESLIAHKGKQINRTILQGIHSAEAQHSQYSIKIYDKGLQFNQDNILRLELHYKKMDNLFRHGLKWGDLQDPNVWWILGHRLIQSFEEIVYFDPSIHLTDVITKKDREALIEGNNPIFWRQNKGPHISRKRQNFKRLVDQYGTSFNMLRAMVEEEISQLIDNSAAINLVNSDQSEVILASVGVVNPDQNEITSQNSEMVNSDHLPNIKNGYSFSDTCENVVKSDTLLSGHNSPQDKSFISPDDNLEHSLTDRICPITLLNINNQKPGSRYLCLSGLRWLMDNDPILLNNLKLSRLSKKWEEEPLDIQLMEIAHSIRNEYYNPRNNTKRSIGRILNHPVLFDPLPYIRPDRLILLR